MQDMDMTCFICLLTKFSKHVEIEQITVYKHFLQSRHTVHLPNQFISLQTFNVTFIND